MPKAFAIFMSNTSIDHSTMQAQYYGTMQALKVMQKGLSVNSQNVAHMATQKPSVLPVYTQSPGGCIDINELRLMSNELSDAKVISAITEQIQLRKESELGQAIESELKESLVVIQGENIGLTHGISTRLALFFSKAQELSGLTQDTGARQAFLYAAKDLAEGIRETYAGLAASSQSIETMRQGDIEIVSEQFDALALLNKKISQAQYSQQQEDEISEVMARRDLLESIAQYGDFRVRSVPSAQHPEDHVPVFQLYTFDADGQELVLVNGSRVNARLTWNENVGFTTTADENQGIALSRGGLKAYDNVLGAVVDPLMQGLNNLAKTLCQKCNEIYGGDFFQVTQDQEASTLSLTQALLQEQAGGNRALVVGNPEQHNNVIVAFAKLKNQLMNQGQGDAFDGTLEGYYTDLVYRTTRYVKCVTDLNQTATQRMQDVMEKRKIQEVPTQDSIAIEAMKTAHLIYALRNIAALNEDLFRYLVRQS
jgi:flagellar hook-associated protein FlgK